MSSLEEEGRALDGHFIFTCFLEGEKYRGSVAVAAPPRFPPKAPLN